jgi:hypothetical protein
VNGSTFFALKGFEFMKALVFVTLSLSCLSSQAHLTSKCSGLTEELMAMKQAQLELMQGLTSNHEVFASSMEEYSKLFNNPQRGHASASISKNMNQSAAATRSRGASGKRMAKTLALATDDLIHRISDCLEQK